MHHGEAVRRREVDSRLLTRGVEVDAVLDRFLQHQFLLVTGNYVQI
jgi:hypothetical protein